MLLGKITSVAVTWHGLHEKGSSPQWVAVKQVVTVVCSASICILIQRKVLIYIDWWLLMISSDGFPVGLPRPTRAGSHICTPVVLQQTLCCIILYLCIKCIILPIMWVLSPLSCFLLLLREGVRKKNRTKCALLTKNPRTAQVFALSLLTRCLQTAGFLCGRLLCRVDTTLRRMLEVGWRVVWNTHQLFIGQNPNLEGWHYSWNKW